MSNIIKTEHNTTGCRKQGKIGKNYSVIIKTNHKESPLFFLNRIAIYPVITVIILIIQHV